MASKRPSRRWATYVLLVLAGLLSLTLGLTFLRHPIAGWAYGIPRRSDAPPVLGVGLLVVPAVLVGVGAWRLWQALVIDREIVRQRRELRARTTMEQRPR